MPTIHDVARKAGVSVATVSRALNGLPGLADETRTRVLAIVDEIGYVPRGRRGTDRNDKKPRTVALITTRDVGAMEGIPIYTRGLAAVRAAAQAIGWNLVFQSDDEGAVNGFDLTHGCEGAIFFACRRPASYWGDLADSGFPFVLANVMHEDGRIPWVAVNERWGAHQVVQRLVKAQRQRIGYIYFAATGVTCPGVPDFERLAAVRGAMKVVRNANVAFETLSIRGTQDSIPAIEQFVDSFDPDALIVYNEILSMLVYVALSQARRQVPKDCAVITFDDTELARSVNPTLSCIHTPIEVVCETAFRHLCQTLDHPGSAVHQTLITPWFVQGQSCGT